MSLPSEDNDSGFVENCSIPSTVGLYKELATNVLVSQMQSRGFNFLFAHLHQVNQAIRGLTSTILADRLKSATCL